MATETADPARLGEPLADGRVAQVYAWDTGRVVKLARDWVPEDWVAYEFSISRIVHAAGLDIPEPYEIVHIDSRAGIVYRRTDGPTMLDRIGAAPFKVRSFGRTLGRLHAGMHATRGAPELPELADRLRRKIESVEGAPENYKRAALEALGALPRGEALLHGDFHPGNVILAQDGPVIIDWPDAARGHPLGDVARTVVLTSLGGLPANPALKALVALLRAAFRSAYLNEYFRRSPLQRADLAPWLFPVLFGRLSENIPSEREDTRRWLARLRPDLAP